MAFFGMMKFDNIENQSKSIMLKFLRDTSDSYKLMTSFNIFYKTTVKIQRFFREHQLMDKYRMDLVRRSWDINRDKMQKQILKAGGKHIKAKLKKILGKARYEEYKKLKDKDIL